MSMNQSSKNHRVYSNQQALDIRKPHIIPTWHKLRRQRLAISYLYVSLNIRECFLPLNRASEELRANQSGDVVFVKRISPGTWTPCTKGTWCSLNEQRSNSQKTEIFVSLGRKAVCGPIDNFPSRLMTYWRSEAP